MKKLSMAFLAFSIFLVAAAVAFAQVITPPETVEQSVGLIPAILEAAMAGKWLIVGSLVVLILTAAFRQYVLPKLTVSTGILPWVALVIAFLNGLAAHVIGGMSLAQAAEMILISGGLAAQFWSLGGKVVTDLILKALGSKGLAE